MASNQATVQDVQARALRPLSEQEQTWAAVRLPDAFRLIVNAVPSVATRIDAAGSISADFPQLVIAIQAAMLLRVLANPDGIRSEGSDDYTRTLDSAISTGSLYVSEDELRQLRAWDGTEAGAFSLLPAYGYARGLVPDPWSPYPLTTTSTGPYSTS